MDYDNKTVYRRRKDGSYAYFGVKEGSIAPSSYSASKEEADEVYRKESLRIKAEYDLVLPKAIAKYKEIKKEIDAIYSENGCSVHYRNGGYGHGYDEEEFISLEMEIGKFTFIFNMEEDADEAYYGGE